MAERDYLSIGEVLSLLQDDFPDVTISKIRFLESQGLLDPERTPSGYRKFYDTDIERLRWILQQQKDHFLPLKVIKGRLEREVEPAAQPSAKAGAPTPRSAEAAPAGSGSSEAGAPGRAADGRRPASSSGRRPPPPARAASRPPAAVEPDPYGAIARTSVPVFGGDEAPAGAIGRDDLVEATGLSVSQLIELAKFGILEERRSGSAVYYEQEAAEIAHLAADFLRHGVEPRHLRMYRSAAEREAALFEQLVLPVLKQRNPEARARAVATLGELADLGTRLRAALLRAALRQHTSGP